MFTDFTTNSGRARGRNHGAGPATSHSRKIRRSVNQSISVLFRICKRKTIFDRFFDGVLCDSVMECLLVSYNAYHQLHESGATRFTRFNCALRSTAAKFRRLRAYLKGAEDFVPMYLAVRQAEIHSQQSLMPGEKY